MKHFSLLLPCLVIVLTHTLASAHCDTMNGPVVSAARRALDAGNVNLVLPWVQQADENAIKEAFEKTMAVRKLGPGAKELADMYFFETVVRIHREGEGVPYTGIKPADTEIETGIALADNAIEVGSVTVLTDVLSHAVVEGLKRRFEELKDKSGFDAGNVKAGREYVKEYVEFIHYVERLHQSLNQPTPGHEPAAQEEHHH